MICLIIQPDYYLFRSVTMVPVEYWHNHCLSWNAKRFANLAGCFERKWSICFNDNWIFSLVSGKSFENCLPWQIKVDNILYKMCYHYAPYICKLADYWPDAKTTFCWKPCKNSVHDNTIMLFSRHTLGRSILQIKLFKPFTRIRNYFQELVAKTALYEKDMLTCWVQPFP